VIREVLIEAGVAASRTKSTYLRAHYVRVKRHRGHKLATVLTGHSVLVSTYHVLWRACLTTSSAATTSTAATMESA
jgi:hypothetical protein